MALNNVDIGAMRIIYKGVDLGNTLDGVEVTIDRKFTDLMVDKYGETPVDKALIGQNLKVKVKLAEPVATNLDAAVPEGDKEFFALGNRLGIGTQSGYLLSADSGLLQLRPLRNVATGVDRDDVNLYKAVSSEPVVLPYKVKDQRVIEVTWTALVDEEFGNGRLLGHIGPLTIS